MDIHTFTRNLHKTNKEDIENIGKLRSYLCVVSSTDLSLPIPAPPSDARPESMLEYYGIHGHVFEDFVLKAAVDDRKWKMKFTGRETNMEEVDNKIKERGEEFERLFGFAMTTKYKDSMAMAGSYAMKMLSEHFTMTQQHEVSFEEVLKNTEFGQLTRTPRADFVARREENAILVDLKFSSKDRTEFEKWIGSGIFQVSFYGTCISMEEDLDIRLGILVYYAVKGEVVLYEIKHEKCINEVKRLAKIDVKTKEDDDIKKFCADIDQTKL